MRPVLAVFIRPLALRAALELVLVTAVFAGAYQVAFRYVEAARTPALIDWELKPAVMIACGHGFAEPAMHSAAVTSFAGRQRDAISCAEFAGAGEPRLAISLAQANRYSIYGAGWAMWLGGVSWRTLDAYLAFLFGLSMVFVYGVFRQAVGRLLAVMGVAALVCSPMLIEIVSLRDFIKLPCFTALWLVLAWLIRRGLGTGVRATMVPMAVAGALVGIGIGLRMDALILAPVFVAVLILGVPGFNRQALAGKGLATLAFVVMFLVAGGPILRSLSSGSNFAHFVVLGAMDPFNRWLSVDPAPYDLGIHYADGYAWTVIASHGLLSQGERLPIPLGSADYDRVGMRLLRTLGLQFPADVMTRALGATFQLFRFPFDRHVRKYSEGLPTFQDSPTVRTVGEWRTWALGAFERRELATAVLVLALASAFNWRLGAIGLLLALVLCGYSMLQYSRRHMFHLDVIPILMALLAVYLPVALLVRVGTAVRRGREEGRAVALGFLRQSAIGLGVVALLVGVLTGTLQAAQAWQQQSVTGLIQSTLRAEWTPVAVHEESLTNLILAEGNPVATWYTPYHADPELWNRSTLLRVDGVVPFGQEAEGPGDLRQQYFRVILEPRCDTRRILIGLKYSGANPTADYEFTRVFRARVSDEVHTELLVPAYYHLGSTWTRFDGFGVPDVHRGCVSRILKARHPAALPMPVLSFLLEPSWKDTPLYQRLRARPEISIAGTPVDPHPDDADVRRSGWRDDRVEPLASTAPPLDQWLVVEGVIVTPDRNGFTVTGNDTPSGYQLVSPPFDVPAGEVLAVQIAGRVTSGEMCVGVLEGAQQRWLLSPRNALAVGLLAETGSYTQVRLVFSNCARPPGTFRVRAITYQSFPREE